ncbi:type III-B CRISPR module RAMP protein Cmr6 [Leptolyngbya sp. 'hensonii']|uniref:RAMP superfamily CRISPR-associated protein n=1 Tax=Leptolyngbya sp. 'hensonii' TaxID=1922337 RepID=UPI00094F7A6C|nr:RAMP superfamily CRISPR-associated protein [Leptolyngbya sp. 'hensonii']OLP17433.1 type III-B CRISPR module RAMP protein Cmr6 [Leptolyngbya sp. 'hensonii']
MVFERPSRPGQSRPNPTARPNATERPTQRTAADTGKTKKVLPDVKGGGGNRGGNRGGGNGGNGNNPLPETSPWLNPAQPPEEIHPSASFVEYLRWMRSLTDNKTQDANTKVQLLQLAEEGANYRERLTTLTERTKQIAGKGNYFQVKSAWRIRVGGHRGPESILLPAFDALGMPYIPSSTLRGVARAQAIRDLAAKGHSWEDAEKDVSRKYFGDLDSKESKEKAGKIIFLDAYPLPVASGQAGGLTIDMANNIWGWKEDVLDYSPNPNSFFSLKEATFLIGIRRASQCKPEEFEQIRSQVEQWLTNGLQAGIGSQVNTGYGSLVRAGQAASKGFFSVDFILEGQLIHGRQRFTQWNWNDRRNEWQMRGQPDAEVRSVAFKSMLRYWFRAFALGVLPVGTERSLEPYLKAIREGKSVSPPSEVKALEAILFGSITPQTRGWVTVRIIDGKVVQPEARSNFQGKNDPCGEQSGTLVLDCSSEAPTAKKQQDAIKALFKHLLWMMFHLGGIGQGARRPCYSRQNRENGRAPWWRGSTLSPDSEDKFWELPDTVQGFQKLFHQHLQDFYQALSQLTNQSLNPNQPRALGEVRRDKWTEAVDANCRIVVCTGKSNFSKPYALAVLHSEELKKNGNYDPDLCGAVLGAKVKPSPVWIADLGDYQVVTVFGATQNPRQQYLRELQSQTSRQNHAQIWGLT